MLPIYALFRLSSAALILLGIIAVGQLVEGACRHIHSSSTASHGRPNAGQVRRSPSF